MFEFWKNNSAIITKLLVTQLGMTVFGILLHSAATVAQNNVLVVAFSIFSVLFYLFLVYTAVWDVGARDKIRIEGKRLEARPLHGALVAVFANIPNFILALLSTVGYFCIDRSVTDASGNLMSPAWAVNLYGVAQIVGSYFNSVYMGVTDALGITVYPFTVLLCALPCIAVSALGYFFGTRERFPIVPEKTSGTDY